MEWIIVVVFALILDRIFADPVGMPHPVIYIGKLISLLEKGFRKQSLLSLKGAGFILALGVPLIVGSFIHGLLLLGNLLHPAVYWGVTLYFLTTGIAAECLKQEGMKVFEQLKKKNLKEARLHLSYLVGRNTEELSEEEVIKATVETVSENTIDGVLAPLFYIFLGIPLGLPLELLWIYKAVNTLDSMVGYVQEPYRDIGYASAKLDDLVNLIPARLGSMVMLIFGVSSRKEFFDGLSTFRRDRRAHKSPNAGHPESVVAGILGIQLGGTHRYFGEVLEKPAIGIFRRRAELQDISRAASIMYKAQYGFLVLWIIAYIFFNA